VEIRHALLNTLAGPLLAVADCVGLRHLYFLGEADSWPLCLSRLVSDSIDPGQEPILYEDPQHFKPLVRQLGEYFTGARQQFDMPLAPKGTQFQEQVWTKLRDIPYGELRSYGQIAGDLGEVRAARAVGQAAGQNPLPILVPCHRVLGARGHLVGFAGGTDLKARLLRLEGHNLEAGSQVRPPRLF